MSRRAECGLLGALYYYLKDHTPCFKTTEEFYNFITAENTSARSNPRKLSYFMRFDCLTETAQRSLGQVLLNRDSYMSRFAEVFQHLSERRGELLLRGMADFVRKTRHYCLRIPQGNVSENEYVLYPAAARSRLLSLLNRPGIALSEALYLYLHYALLKTLPEQSRSASDLAPAKNEFLQRITEDAGFGPGARERSLRLLAEDTLRPNPVAQYHLGISLAFGETNIPPDPDAALDFILRSAAVSKLGDPPAEHCFYPALCAVSRYLLARCGIPAWLDSDAAIPLPARIQDLKPEDAGSMALDYARESYRQTPSGQAADLMGLAAAALPELLRREQLPDAPEFYLRQSADSGYAPASLHLAKQLICKAANIEPSLLKGGMPADKDMPPERAESAEASARGSITPEEREEAEVSTRGNITAKEEEHGEISACLNEACTRLAAAAERLLPEAVFRLGRLYCTGTLRLPDIGEDLTQAPAIPFPLMKDEKKGLCLLTSLRSYPADIWTARAMLELLTCYPDIYEGQLPLILSDVENIGKAGSKALLRELIDALEKHSLFGGILTPVVGTYAAQLLKAYHR